MSHSGLQGSAFCSARQGSGGRRRRQVRCAATWQGLPGDRSAAVPSGCLVGSSATGTHEPDPEPANILIAEAAPGLPPLVKLADFGISVVARDDKAEAAGKQAISPLVSLLTGEADAEEVSLSELSIEEPHGPAAAPRERDRRGSAPAAGPAGAARADDLTEAGMIVGTPMYMAPEISFGSRLAQPASDVFALGVIAYELLTKELPFRRPPVGTVLRQETLRIPLGLRALTHLDPLLLSLFERALSMDPAQRPSAAELAAALTVEPTTVISSLHGR